MKKASKKPRVEASNEKEEGEIRKRNVDREKESEPRMRYNNSISRIYKRMQSVRDKKNGEEIMQCLKTASFSGMLEICNWTMIKPFFVEWVVKNFELEEMQIRLSKNKVLKLKDEDVSRIYGLPRVGKKIMLHNDGIETLRKELLMEGDATEIHVNELEALLDRLVDSTVWAKVAIMLIIYYVLCLSNQMHISLKYARVLRTMECIASYNWFEHVLDHVKDGIPSTIVKNPTTDFHFLLINYLEHMGKNSPLMTGRHKYPSLGGWDVQNCHNAIKSINKYMGLERGITVGITKERKRDEGPVVIPFQAESCPISKAPKLVEFCKSTITIYTACLETLEERISGGKRDVVVSDNEERITPSSHKNDKNNSQNT